MDFRVVATDGSWKGSGHGYGTIQITGETSFIQGGFLVSLNEEGLIVPFRGPLLDGQLELELSSNISVHSGRNCSVVTFDLTCPSSTTPIDLKLTGTLTVYETEMGMATLTLFVKEVPRDVQ